MGPDPQQGALFEEAEATVPPQSPEAQTNGLKPKIRKPRGRTILDELPDHLPRETIVIESDVDLAGLRCIGVERTQYLKRVPSKMIVAEILRRKYVDPCKEDRGVIIGKLPSRVADKGTAGPSMLADAVVSKYCDHLPLNRQWQRFRREGIKIAKATLAGWIAQTAWHLNPLNETLKRDTLSSGYLQADETTIKVQDRTKTGTIHRGYYWFYHAPEQKLLVVEYRKGRASAGPVAFLRGYNGALQTDGYVAYDVCNAHSSMTVYECMAHERRKFNDRFTYEPDKADPIPGGGAHRT